VPLWVQRGEYASAPAVVTSMSNGRSSCPANGSGKPNGRPTWWQPQAAQPGGRYNDRDGDHDGYGDYEDESDDSFIEDDMGEDWRYGLRANDRCVLQVVVLRRA